VLRAIPGDGPVKVAAPALACGIDTRRRVGGLGGEQRRKLLDPIPD